MAKCGKNNQNVSSEQNLFKQLYSEELRTISASKPSFNREVSILLLCVFQCCRPENVPRLFDLIKVNDPSLRPAFYFAVRDTLVAKDLEQATRIAYGAVRYRVVTLNGQLIDTSGDEIQFIFVLFFINFLRIC